MSQDLVNSYPNPDRAALIRAGSAVRRRLAAVPKAEALATGTVDLHLLRDFLTPDECAALCAMVDRTAEPSAVYDHGYAADYRTSWSGNLDRYDPLVAKVEKRIDALLGIPHAYGEPIQGQRYLEGQEFRQHNDWLYTLAPYWKQEAKTGGQRCYTAMAYLNPVEGGGTTDFTRIGLSVPPLPGALLVWNNATREGFPNDATMHAGTPVTRGVKYVITKWYRTRKWG